MSDLFVAQFARPAELSEVNLRTLTPYQRALLVIDGTVTKFVEAYLMEPVEVVRLGQARQLLSADHEWLEVPKGTPIIARHVVLQGKYSHALFAYAVSLIVPDRLPEAVKRELESDDASLGRILLGNQLETRREILWYGRERNPELPKETHHRPGDEFISRTYRIISQARPIMLINEKFPYVTDHLPLHD